VRRAAAGVGVAVLLSLLIHAPHSNASARCSHSGAPLNELRIVPYADPRKDLDFADATIRRVGKRILVLSQPFHKPSEAVRCDGRSATTFNTDRILFDQRGFSFGRLDLSGGLPAAETRFLARRGALAYGIVRGTGGPDRWALGGNRRSVGLSFGGSLSNEFDVVFDGPGRNVVVAEPGAGNDRVDASRVADRSSHIFLKGGPGADMLIGSSFRDAIDGGPGRDLLRGGAGADLIFARDGFRDVVRCGSGKDTAHIDGRDLTSGCEKLERTKQRTDSPR
jgi:hypothetical protein